MTYRLSIPTPLEGGIESHHHCGSILLQRLDSNYAYHHRTNFDNENGNWVRAVLSAIPTLPTFQRAGVTVKVVWAMRIWVIVYYIFRSAALN